MRAFAQHGYCGQELSELNRCRMFLHAIWLSDICDGTGKEILVDCWEGRHPMRSPYNWPPTVIHSVEWLRWQQALQKCFGLDRWRHLSQPLGRWYPVKNGWFYKESTNRLWYHDTDGWQHFHYIPSWSCTRMYEAAGDKPEGTPRRAQLSHAMVLDC